MATRWAVATGNWSSTATWNGGTLPSAGDDVHANTFTVTIDQTVNVGSLRNTAGTGITAGGTFALTTAQTITLTGAQGIFPGNAVNPVLTISHGTGTATVSGVMPPGAGANQLAATVTGAGHVNFIGNFGNSTGTGANAISVLNTAMGTYTFTGPVAGSASGNGSGIFSASTVSQITVTGSVTGGPSGAAVNTAGPLSVVGDITAAGNSGVALVGNATLVHTGLMTASSSAPAVTGSSAASTVTSTGPFVSSSVRPAVYGHLRISLATTTTNHVLPSGDGGTRTLYTADNVGGNPAATNVRSGTAYGPANELTGTLIVPSPANVASGVPTDHTVGTATLSAADVAAAVWADGGRGAKLDSLQTSIVVVS